MGAGKILSVVVWFIFLSFTTEAQANRNPFFTEILEYGNVPEEEAGSYVGTLVAEDLDDDNLTYGIQDTAPQYLEGNPYSDPKQYLHVDPVSGNVTVQKPVDRELTTSLRPTWTVTDGSQLITAVGYLFVTDKNDVTPRFRDVEDRLQPVPENTAVSENITSFSVADEDDKNNGLVDVTFVADDMDCDEIHPFEIKTLTEGKNNFQLIVADELDYSVKSQYSLCLVAEDRAGGGKSLKSNVSKISIPIRDVQDKPPVFLNLPYSAEIAENNEVGAFVEQVTAQDGDRGVPVPNPVELTLDSPYFEIDSDGVITTKASLDREGLDENPFRLSVVATEVDSTQPIELRESEATVVITILDEDDNSPEFSNASVQVDLFENSQIGTRLNLGVTVTDADEPGNAFFYLEINQSLDAFELVKETGRGSALVDVKVKDSTLIDYEIRQQMNFTIKASSALGNESSLEVTVNIINLNDNDPVFNEDDGYQGEFAEDVPAGHSILTVQATDEDIGAVVSYAINPPVKEFEVGESSGVITTSAVAKFNALQRPEYVFTVEASDGEIAKQTLVTLQCTDVNDNAPVFQRHFEEIFWTEFNDEIPDEAIITLTAFDADPTSPNNNFSYSISDGDPDRKFRIDDTSGELYFVDFVDYDIGDKAYFLTISAIDHGSPPMEGTTTLNVTIEDANDNAPEFDEDVYTFSVREDVDSQHVVGTVTATDGDSEMNNIQIDYNLIDTGGGIFFITSGDNVGFIRVGGGLDKETAPEDGYSLTVSAQDRGSPPLSTSCLVNIIVIDVNDEKPVFDPDQELKYSVSEDASPGFQVLTLHATDPDGNNKLSYHIEEVIAKDEMGDEVVADFSNQFSCDENDGTISINEALDREYVETFLLDVVVIDNNAETEEQQDTATVTITIMDVNDNAPVFESMTDDLTVIEGSASGTIVSTDIRATDADKGSNGEITYSLEDDAGGAFRIDGRTGNLRVNNDALVDHEKYEMLTITVRATDGGSPSNFTEKDVNIEIEDINDNTPVFRKHPYSGTVLENSAIDTFVCNVTADDMDATFGVLNYTIVGGNTDEWFKINIATGDISVANSGIDREEVDEVILVVEAVDPGQRRDTTEVIIEIEDENDKAPTFTFFENSTIPENFPNGTVVTTVVATDEDKPDTNASAIVYSVLGGSGTDYFGINEETGEVVTTDVLDDGNPSNESRIYDIIIQAKDQAEPFNSVKETMFIVVDDAGNNAPVITHPKDGSFHTMPEHYDNKLKPVLTAEASDSDAGNDSKIAFRLAEIASYDWPVFRVETYSGEIFYEGEPPDWSEKPQFRLILEAYNYLSASEEFDSVDFTINVTDIDNHDPAFPTAVENETATAEMKVQEKLEGGTLVGSVSATDKDDGNPIYYFIIDGNDDGYFEINKYTGEIFTTEELDGSSISRTSYDLTIKATENETYGEDGATRRRRQASPDEPYDPTIILVTVNIVDLNDNPPYFPEELYTAGVVYTADFDVIVTRVSAEDDDPDENNRNMTYSILSQDRLSADKEIIKEDDTAFYIDPKTGDIYTMTSFLRLKGGVYFQLRIKVVDPDSESEKFNDQTELLIYVIIESQQLNIYTSVSADETKNSEEKLAEKLDAILLEYAGGSYETDFDRISSHVDSSGKINANQSDALFHVVNLTDSVNEIVPAPDVLYILDHSPAHVDDVREEFSVNVINLAAYKPEEPKFTSFQFAVVILAGIFLVFLILAILAFFFYQNQNQKTLEAYGVVIENDYQLPNDEPLTKTANPVHHNPGYNADDDEDYEDIAHEGSETSTIEKVMTLDDDEEEPPAAENTRNSKFLETLLLNQQKLDDASDELHISDV